MIFARILGTTPRARSSSASPSVRPSFSNVSVVETTTLTAGGTPIGLLLALTYSGTSTSTTRRGAGPYSRIK